MTTFIKKLLAASLLALSFACGGRIDDAGDPQDIKAALSFEPFTSYTAARAHAARYGANPRAIVLSGTLSSDGQGYDWRWTFQCDGSVYAVVSAGPQSVRVVTHGIRTWLMGVAAFDPSKVNVNAGDLLQLLKKQGYAQPESMSLTEPLTQKPAPRWTTTVSKKTVLVDATSGAVSG